MEAIVQSCNQSVENLTEFLIQKEFKPSKNFDYIFEKIINNNKQAIIFKVLLHSNDPKSIYCVININKMLSKQQKSQIFEFINNLSGTYPFFSFHFKEHSNECSKLCCRLTWYSSMNNAKHLITAYENMIIQDVYPVIIKFLAEL